MRPNKITIGLVAGFLLTGQVSALAQGDRPPSGGDAPALAAEAADAPAKAATPSSETSMTPAAGEPSISLAQLPRDPRPGAADTIVKAVMIGLAVVRSSPGRSGSQKKASSFWCTRCGSSRATRTRQRTLAKAHEKLHSSTDPVTQLMHAAANEIRPICSPTV